MSAEVLWDKIRGGLLGQMLGNLNGIPHEMQYIDEPGNVAEYTPALPDGARTDDDTDFEWVYVVEMQKANRVRLSSTRIAELGKQDADDQPTRATGPQEAEAQEQSARAGEKSLQARRVSASQDHDAQEAQQRAA